jgi:GNAT superfamily N-acetyltransferase
MTAHIRNPDGNDEPAWRALWAGYNEFYKTNVAEAVTKATWRRILDPASPMFARLAERDGTVVGFSLSVLHEGTWTVNPICYLEDLFVDPAVRGGGIGHALIQDLIDLGKAKDWSYLYWHTQAGNEAGRRLYDRFSAADDFVRYRLPLR